MHATAHQTPDGRSHSRRRSVAPLRASSGLIESPASRPATKVGAVAQIGGLADIAAIA